MKIYLVSGVMFATIGIATDSLFNGLHQALNSLRACERPDFKLPAKSSLWALVVYGLVPTIFFGTCWYYIQETHWIARGFIYMVIIHLTELIWGTILAKYDLCTWNYKDARWNVGRYTRLDWAPFWFAYGFVLETAYKAVLRL